MEDATGPDHGSGPDLVRDVRAIPSSATPTVAPFGWNDVSPELSRPKTNSYLRLLRLFSSA